MAVWRCEVIRRSQVFHAGVQFTRGYGYTMVLFNFLKKKLSSQSLDSLFGIDSSGAEITHNLNWRRSCNGIMMHQISQSVKSIALMLQYFG